MNIEQRVLECFADAVGVEATSDKSKIIYNEISGWDSVAHMALVAALEEAFDCMLDMDDIIDMSDYGKVVEIMAKYV